MKNQTNLNQVTDMKLRSQADLQITKNKLQDVAVEIENQDRIIKEKKNQIDKQKIAIQQLNTELKQKKDEIDKKDGIIHQREKNILTLKKRT